MKFLLGLLIVCIVFVHIFSLETLPRGLFLDEYSIGLNAASMNASGTDEFGTPFPVYFKAFGEYKNPVYIYAASLVFKIGGVSDYNLRLTSALFFLVGFFFFLGFLQRQCKNVKITFIGGCMYAFLPLFFTISRVSFEVISHVSIMSIFLFLLTYLFQKKICFTSILLHLFSGFIFGLTLYSYTTARLLTPLFFLVLFFLYFRKGQILHFLSFLLATTITFIPFLIIWYHDPAIVLTRFSEISFLYDGGSLWDHVQIFFQNLKSYFSPDFLLLHGDPNLRHHSGFMGAIPLTIFLLSMTGIIGSMFIKDLRSKIGVLIMSILIFTPIAAASTESNHALRVAIIGLPFIYFAILGFQTLAKSKKYKYVLITIAVMGLFTESGLYIQNWFTIYPTKTVQAFGTLGANEIATYGISKNIHAFFISDQIPKAETLAKYYAYKYKSATFIVVKTENIIIANNKFCLMTTLSEKEIRNNPNLKIVPFPPSSKIIGACHE